MKDNHTVQQHLKTQEEKIFKVWLVVSHFAYSQFAYYSFLSAILPTSANCWKYVLTA